MWLCERAILTPKTDHTYVVSHTLLKSFENTEYQYKSVGIVVQTYDARPYPVEFLIHSSHLVYHLTHLSKWDKVACESLT